MEADQAGLRRLVHGRDVIESSRLSPRAQKVWPTLKSMDRRWPESGPTLLDTLFQIARAAIWSSARLRFKRFRKHSDAAEIRKGALAAGRERMKSATVVRLSVM